MTQIAATSADRISALTQATAAGATAAGATAAGATAADRAVTLHFADNTLLALLLGDHDRHLVRMEQGLGVRLSRRGNELTIVGPPDGAAIARRLVEQLYIMARAGTPISPEDIGRAAIALRADADVDLRDVFSDTILVAGRARPIAPKGLAQKRYVDAIRNFDIVFGIGPAGTGKTYLAVAQAVAMLQAGSVDRIVLSRPAVEAGERLGFLPGDLKEKVDPYLRPLYDALHDMMPGDQVVRRMGTGEIEVAPLAFMRGRTLAHAFVILDEAQNTTPVGVRVQGGDHRRRHAD